MLCATLIAIVSLYYENCFVCDNRRTRKKKKASFVKNCLFFFFNIKLEETDKLLNV